MLARCIPTSFWRARSPFATRTSATARRLMLISIDRLSKRYANQTTPVLALDDISLGIARDEFVSIIGPSGCGKSSLLMITAGLVPATSGSVIIAGQDIRKPYTDLGIVFQKDALLDWRN